MGHSYGVLITINPLNVFTLLGEKQLEEFCDWIKCSILEKKNVLSIITWNVYNSSHELHNTIVNDCFYKLGSTLAENIRYLMYKVEPVVCGIPKELCAIRENTSSSWSSSLQPTVMT